METRPEISRFRSRSLHGHTNVDVFVSEVVVLNPCSLWIPCGIGENLSRKEEIQTNLVYSKMKSGGGLYTDNGGTTVN